MRDLLRCAASGTSRASALSTRDGGALPIVMRWTILDMDEREPSTGEVKHLKFLKWLVTLLTVTMIGGVLTIVALLVMRFGAMNDVPLPDEIVLPDGSEAVAFTQGTTWFAVVTADDQILIFSRATGEILQTVQVVPE